MKTTVAVLGALATSAMAQQMDLSKLPPCGQVCVTNMMGLAPPLGCPGLEPSCLCQNVNFGYGIRDCSYQSCQTTGDAAKVVEFGVAYCASAGIAVTTGPVNTATVVIPTGTTTVSINTGATAIATSTFQTVITSGSSTYTTQVVTTVSGVAGVVGATSLPGSAITTIPIVTTIVSGGSTMVSTIGSSTLFSTLTGSAASSALSSQASAASSAASASSASAASTSTSSGFAAQKTAAPVGFLAAAGLAAMLL